MQKTVTLLDLSYKLQNEIVSLRRQIHENPELSFKEVETAKLAANKLKELGYEVKTGLAKTGVIADLGKVTDGPTVAIRADMDGLPIVEATGLSFQSKKEGVMHACGHDAHVSCALACAKLLKEEKLSGRIRMLMQPAEEDSDSEGKSGAFRMIEAGAMEGVNAVIGLHMDATLPAGKVGIIPGPCMAAADSFRVKITGKGGHGAYPEAAIDSVVLASHVVVAIQQIVSRRISALDPAVVTVGSIHSESIRGNVISQAVTIQGTIRSYTKEVRATLMAELERACSVAKALGGDFELSWHLGYPATVNDQTITAVMHEAACDLIGKENVISIQPKVWSEDFSMLAEVAPGAFMFLGGEIKGDRRAHHSPNFDIDESGLYIGPAILAETARRLVNVLGKKK